MKLKIIEGSENYTATVVKIGNKQKLDGLDNIVGVDVFGNLCLVSKTYPVESLYLFFPCECVISKEFLSNNNMYRHKELNANNELNGYFEDDGRVRALKFKGHKCTGLLVPIYFLESIGISNHAELKVGDEFNEIDGVSICRKFTSTRNSKADSDKSSILSDLLRGNQYFPKHFDTPNLLKKLSSIKNGDSISVSYKMHGTSCRCGFTKVKRKLSFWERMLLKLNFKIERYEYRYVVGSRNKVTSVDFKSDPDYNGFYADTNLYNKVSKDTFDGKLHKGEMVYFEIVGKTYSKTEIQKKYSYGLEAPYALVYRISNINDSGVEVDLSVQQMVKRCQQIGVRTVPILFDSKVYTEDMDASFFDMHINKPSVLNIELEDGTSAHVKNYKPPVEEGICVRVENYPNPKIYKLKSKDFLIYETNCINESLEKEGQYVEVN